MRQKWLLETYSLICGVSDMKVKQDALDSEYPMWFRFDHFAILCEVWPVGLPSLAVNLQTMLEGVYDRQVLSKASKILNCTQTMDIDFVGGVAAQCRFPGQIKVTTLLGQT